MIKRELQNLSVLNVFDRKMKQNFPLASKIDSD